AAKSPAKLRIATPYLSVMRDGKTAFRDTRISCRHVSRGRTESTGRFDGAGMPVPAHYEHTRAHRRGRNARLSARTRVRLARLPRRSVGHADARRGPDLPDQARRIGDNSPSEARGRDRWSAGHPARTRARTGGG